MITISENISLQPYNSFGIEVKARYFCRISSAAALQELIASAIYHNTHHLILGEGSNILFTKDFEGLVIKMEIKGIEIIYEDDEKVKLSSGAGESWHGLVMYCVDHDYGGIENLSLIPGTVGAAPIQNIGAYGVEIKNCIDNVTAIDTVTGDIQTFTNQECRFDYRESVFKNDFSKKYFISSITLSLTKKNHVFNISYGAIQDTLKQQYLMNKNQVNVKSISDAVIAIRQQKLPDVSVLGSAGSFFKNPSVTLDQLESIKKTYPKIPSYPSVNQKVKIPAGWLIEQCGWKGKRFDDVGVHQHQALVLVNYGGGTGEQIFNLAMNIRDSVKEKFDVVLETEVNIL